MGLGKRAYYAAGFTGTASGLKITAEVTGDKKLDKALAGIVAEDGNKSLKAEFRKLTRKACRDMILPEVRREIPEDTGFLESQLTVKAMKRSRKIQGHYVGFPDEIYTGDTFYGGILEFGFRHWAAGWVEAEGFLRRPLYRNESRVKGFTMQGLRLYVMRVDH